MVFVEEKSAYLQKFDKENEFYLLREFLQKHTVNELEGESSKVHKLFYSLLYNDASCINDVLTGFSLRKPTSESDYINKDLLIFLLICVTKKFELENEWLLNFVNQRKSPETEKNSITKTFYNLLTDNLESKDNCFEIIIVYKNILGIKEQDESVLNKTYEKLSKLDFPFYGSDFLNLIAIRAIDIIILNKGTTTFKEYENLKSFSEIFDKRTTSLSIFFSYLINFTLLCFSIFVAYKLFFGSKEESDIADKLFTAFGFLVLGAGLVYKKTIENTIQKLIKRFFGRKENVK